MHNATAIGALPPLQPSGPVRNWPVVYARALTFTAWFFCLLINYWWRQEWDDIYKMLAEGQDVKKFYYIGFGIAAIGHLTLGFNAWISAPFRLLSTSTGKMLTAFCLLAALLAPFSAAPQTTALYSAATWCVILLCFLFWTSDYRIVRRVLVFTGFVLFAWLLILLVHHGLRQQSIGGINRNMVATAALVAMIGTLFADQKIIRWTGMALALFFLVAVSSRGSLLVLVEFLALYYALHEGSTKAAIVGVLMVVIGALVLLVSSSASDAILEKLLHLHSRDRGIGSGFTGRWDSWQMGLEHIGGRLVLGHGFRVTSTPASGIPLIHSGYINLLLETGVVGTLLILGTMITAIIQRTLLIMRIRKSIGSVNPWTTPWSDTIQLNAIAVGVLSLSLVIWVYEPVYINLGSVLSLLLLLMLVAPMYAPATVNNLKR